VEPQALAAHMGALVGPCCRLTAAAATLMGRVRRLFFMSEHQDLSRFLVTNLGITKYPQYRSANRSSRQEVFCFVVGLLFLPLQCCISKQVDCLTAMSYPAVQAEPP
jgi:hypothetical protein